MEDGFKSLNVYKIAFKLAMEIFEISKSFPLEEKYSLTDQIRRSSRSVCANIGEGYRKREYPKLFTLKMTEADGECSETMIWLDFSKECNYISLSKHELLTEEYKQVGKMLGGMALHPEKFIPKKGITIL